MSMSMDIQQILIQQILIQLIIVIYANQLIRSNRIKQ